MKIEFLRKKYPKFIYKSYSWKISKKNLEIFFDFKAEPDIVFSPKLTIKGVENLKIKKEIINNLVFNLGLIELLSYWKATCSPEIEIQAGKLNKEQINWWKNLIARGMGQFFYENKINWKKPEFIQITPKSPENGSPEPPEKSPEKVELTEDGSPLFSEKRLKEGVLVPIGGGKDSIVAVEMLKNKYNIKCFCLNPTTAAKKVIKRAGCKNPIIVERKIDKKLLELNRQGFLNGHTPFSAYLAFLTVLTSVIFNKRYIALSNERSSNEGNLKYLEQEINHQYSKSFDFEKKFKNYSKKYLAKDIEYFSFLRPLYEIQITKLFSKHEKHFNSFLSCNEAHKTNSDSRKPTKKWCSNCSKCLFVFSCLYPFVENKKLIKIFGQNLFENKKLVPLMKELIGLKKFKPFECVGTQKETLTALYLSYKKNIKAKKQLPYLLKWFQKTILPKNELLHPSGRSIPSPRQTRLRASSFSYHTKGRNILTAKNQNWEKESKKLMNSWNNQHNLPKEFLKILKINKFGKSPRDNGNNQ